MSLLREAALCDTARAYRSVSGLRQVLEPDRTPLAANVGMAQQALESSMVYLAIEAACDDLDSVREILSEMGMPEFI